MVPFQTQSISVVFSVEIKRDGQLKFAEICTEN